MNTDRCFYLLDRAVITDSQRSDLLAYADQHRDQFYMIPYAQSINDGNQLLHVRGLPWLRDLAAAMPFTVQAFVLVRHSAGVRVLPHRDRDLRRSTVIATALEPLHQYADTVFYQGGSEVRCQWQWDKSVILNTQQIHTVENGADTRTNFQICFREGIDEVISAIKELYAGTVSVG